MNRKENRQVNIRQIRIKDDFWSGLQNLVADDVIPYQEKVLNDEIPGIEKSHAIANFRIAADWKRASSMEWFSRTVMWQNGSKELPIRWQSNRIRNLKRERMKLLKL